MSFDSPAHPVYFIAQCLGNHKVTGILVNAHQHQQAPLVMAMEYSDFTDSERPLIGQLWSVSHYRWCDGAREKTHISMESNTLCEHAVARPGAQLVRNTEVYTHTATVSRVKLGQKNRAELRVQVSYERMVEGVYLGKQQFNGLFADFVALKQGDSVPVKMIKLQESCQVDGRYRIVFPNVADREGRALITSRLIDTFHLTKAFSGDYFPLSICGSKNEV
jgi:hypothetical protein